MQVSIGLGFSFLLFTALFGGITYLAWQNEQRLSAWPSTTGTIIASTVETRYSSFPGQKNYKTWVVNIKYRYTIDAKEYERETYDDYSNSPEQSGAELGLGPSKSVLALSKRFAPGTVVPVYYSPRHPERGYLVLDMTGSRYFGLITFFFLLASFVAFSFWFRK